MNRRVSVIIPVYNKRIYLQDCLRSLMRQTWQDTEIIAVNDGSTDGSPEALEALAAEDGRIRLFRIAHGGPSAARNAGMEKATGAYVTFADADDYAEPGYIEHLIQGIGDADLCLAGKKIWEQREDRWEETRCCRGAFSREEFLERIASLRELLGGIGWKLYRKAFLEDHRITFPEGIDRGEDNLFTARALLHLQKIACTDTSEYVVRKHDLNSLTHQPMRTETAEKVLEAYGQLEREAKHPALIAAMKRRQTECLGQIGRILCCRELPMGRRKQLFFEAAEKHHLLPCRGIGGPGSKNAVITRFSLRTRTFLPFYLLTTLWLRHKGEMKKLYMPR